MGLPGNVRGGLVLRPAQLSAVHLKSIAGDRDGAIPTAMDRIELEQMGASGGIASRIIDVNQLNAGTPPERPKHQPADPTEAVDSDAHAIRPPNGHRNESTEFDASMSVDASAWDASSIGSRYRLS